MSHTRRMLLNLLLAFVASFPGWQTAAATGGQVPHPSPVGATPTACLTEVRDFSASRQKDVPPVSATNPAAARSQQLRDITQAAGAMAKDCLARFDEQAVPAKELISLARLHQEASDTAGAWAPVARALDVKTFTPTERAELLAFAIQVVRSTTVPGGRDGRVAGTYTRIEPLVDELDKGTGATFDQKFSAHQQMLSSYRGDDIDAGIIKHATWILNESKSFTPDQHKKYGPTLIAAHVDMAEAWAGQGMTDKAIALLRSGAAALEDIPRSAEQFGPEIDRLQLVGTRAATITAPRWLNAPAAMKDYAFAGKVTLVEFTAHWCGPCRESYPGINRLRAEFGSKGLNVVMVTRYWGYFSSPEKGLERPLSADVELERDKAYFAEHKLDVPVAVGDLVSVKVVNGQVAYEPGPDPNDTAYHVSGIPQIQIIDKKGVIRRIMVGYDNANEPGLAAFIRQLLNEK